MQESILGLFSKRNKKTEEPVQVEETEKEEEATEQKDAIEKEMEIIEAKTEVKSEEKTDLEKKEEDDYDEIRKKRIIQIPVCNFGPDCKCNPDLSELMKESEIKEKPKKKIRKVAKRHGPFEYNLKVDFHDANSNFYQLLSSEDEDEQYEYVEEDEEDDISSTIDYKESEELTNEVKSVVNEVTEDEESESNSFISTFSEDEVAKESKDICDNVDGEVEEEEEEEEEPVPDIDEGQTSDNQHREESETLEENLEIKTNVSEHLEEVMINNLVADDDDGGSSNDTDPGKEETETEEVYNLNVEKDDSTMVFTIVDLPHESGRNEVTVEEDKTEDCHTNGITADHNLQLDNDIGKVATIAEEKINQVNDSCRETILNVPSKLPRGDDECDSPVELDFRVKAQELVDYDDNEAKTEVTVPDIKPQKVKSEKQDKMSTTRLDSKYTRRRAKAKCPDRKVTGNVNLKSKNIERNKKKFREDS